MRAGAGGLAAARGAVSMEEAGATVAGMAVVAVRAAMRRGLQEGGEEAASEEAAAEGALKAVAVTTAMVERSEAV